MPTQRRSIRLAALGLVFFLAVLAGGIWWWRSDAPPGLVVVVSIDTLRADRLPVYGYGQGRTPAIDAFARDAVLFERAYAHVPQTLPSHASIFTGRLPFDHGVRDNLGFTLAPGTQTLASLFRATGYPTGGFVSSYVLRQDTGIAQGFDVYDAEMPAVASDRPWGQVQRPGPETLDAAERWLDTLADDRALMFLHLYEPHTPYAPPAQHRDLRDPYDGEVAFADEMVGRLLASLKARGWYDRATIVITADHGEGLGEHNEDEHGFFLYAGVIRVPLLIKQPRQVNGGTRRVEPVQHIDLLPTLATAAGVTVPAGLRGRDLAPLLTGSGSIVAQGIYSEAYYSRLHFGWSELLSITEDRYRYIQAPREELYDLERDPGESTNIAAERVHVVSAMQSGLAAITAGRTLGAPAAVSDATRERLASLGYVGPQRLTPSAVGGRLADPKDKVRIMRLYRQAIEHLGALRLAEGTQGLRAILDEDPEMTEVWAQYATTLAQQGRQQEAYQAWRQFVRRKPEEPSGLLSAASVLVDLNRLDEARTYADLAIRLAPAGAHQALAVVALMQGRDAEALRHADLAERADPTLPMLLLVRGLQHYNRDEYEAALPLLMQARDRFAKRPIQAGNVNFFIGDTLARLGRYAEAEPFLREEIRLYPGKTRPRVGLVMLYAATGRAAEVERAIEDLLLAVPTQDSYKVAADIFTRFGLPARAAAVRDAGQRRFGR